MELGKAEQEEIGVAEVVLSVARIFGEPGEGDEGPLRRSGGCEGCRVSVCHVRFTNKYFHMLGALKAWVGNGCPRTVRSQTAAHIPYTYVHFVSQTLFK